MQWTAGTLVKAHDTAKKIWEKYVIHHIQLEPNAYGVKIYGAVYHGSKMNLMLRLPALMKEDNTVADCKNQLVNQA